VQSLVIWCDNDKVVHVSMDILWVLPFQRGKDMIHHALECSRGIAEPKWYNFGSEEPLLCFYYHDLLTAGVDSNVIILVSDVKFGHEFGLLHLVKYDVNPGQRVHIWDGPLIDFSIIVNWLPLATLLFDVEERARPWQV
jgi:hypothetical protein